MPDGLSESDALERLRETGDAILDGVSRSGAQYVVRRTQQLLDAWGRLMGDARGEAEVATRAAASGATTRVVGELRALLALDPADQRATPLQIVRTVGREATEVLKSIGVPPVQRDEFEARALPEDVYGFAPHNLGDLGDQSLAPLHLAWGVAKAAVLRARASS